VKRAVLPKPEEFIKNEVLTLKFMGDNSNLRQTQGKFAHCANRQYIYYKDKYFRKAGWRAGFSFGSWLEFPKSSIVKKAWIESLITVKGEDSDQYDQVTYSFRHQVN
jgi:hypothetical protein